MPDGVGREPLYDVFADEFLDHARDGIYNAHYDRPACLELLGDVRGLRVLDAACGPGLYAQALVEKGAEVVGCDISPRMVVLAKQQLPDVEFLQQDLNERLAWAAEASFDAALLALAIEHVDNRIGLLQELGRVLRPNGALVLSLQHPLGSWLRHGGSYFTPKVIDEIWRDSWRVRYWIQPLQQWCDEVRQAGFLIERLVEPRPSPAAKLDEEHYRRLLEEPVGFLAMRLIPDPRGR